MDRSRRAVDRQRALVETLGRQLRFELLVLERMAPLPDAKHADEWGLKDVLDRAVMRDVERLCLRARPEPSD